MSRKIVALFGGGPACLMAAEILSDKFDVHLYEKGKTVGRKFLVAGNGGFNLTNQAVGQELTSVYSKDGSLKKALQVFDSQATRNWLEDLGVSTFIGSSGRVFPEKGVKPAEVLTRIKSKLIKAGVNFHLKHEFIGFNEQGAPLVEFEGETNPVTADHYVFGLGGGSWKKTGANDLWLKYFDDIGIKTMPFEASNCGLSVEWPAEFVQKHHGKPLKNITLSCGTEIVIKGEALITRYGLEGNAVYPISACIREAFRNREKAIIKIDLKPNNSVEQLLQKVNTSLKPKNYPFHFNLDKVMADLVKMSLSKEAYLNPRTYAMQLKCVPLTVSALRPIDEAISTVGGIAMEEVDDHFLVRKNDKLSVVGEMLNWDAPTGGFLLQGCFATAHVAAQYLIKEL